MIGIGTSVPLQQRHTGAPAVPTVRAVLLAHNRGELGRLKDTVAQGIGGCDMLNTGQQRINTTIVSQHLSAVGTPLHMRRDVLAELWIQHIVEIGAEIPLRLLASHRLTPPPCSNAR